MISSMTGYGQGEKLHENGSGFKVEIRSLNQRYLDITIRMPREYLSLEEKIRNTVRRQLNRGRVEVFVSRQAGAAEKADVLVDRNLVVAYREALLEIKNLCGLQQEPALETLALFPDVLRLEAVDSDLEKEWKILEATTDMALVSLLRQRNEEGKYLAQDISERVNVICKLADKIAVRVPVVVEEYRKKMEERISSYLQGAELDQARLLTEAAIFADRSDISEELTRIKSHASAFKDTLAAQGPAGRKLDFMVQELNREVNTIGSKAGDYEIANLVVEAKTELEKIREQVQNIE